jgi:hypothetical protein
MPNDSQSRVKTTCERLTRGLKRRLRSSVIFLHEGERDGIPNCRRLSRM